jgi:hypothetical protein
MRGARGAQDGVGSEGRKREGRRGALNEPLVLFALRGGARAEVRSVVRMWT